MVLNNNKYMVGEKGGGKWGEPDQFSADFTGDRSGGTDLSTVPKTLEQLRKIAEERKLTKGGNVFPSDTVTHIDSDLAGFLDRGTDMAPVQPARAKPVERVVDEFDDNIGVDSAESGDIGLRVVPEANVELSRASATTKPKKHERKNLRYESEFKGLEDQLIGILERERDYIVEDVSIVRDKNGKYVVTIKFKQRGPRGKKIRSLKITGSSHADLEKTVSEKSLGLPQASKRR